MSEESRAEATRERRLNPDAAHELLVQFYPDEEQRKLCMRFLADSIRVASQYGPSKWSVSLRERKKRIQLNVGRLPAIRFKAAGEVVISIDPSVLSPEAKAFLKEHAVEGIHFLSEPDLRGYYTHVAYLAEALTHLQEAHQRFIARAAETVRQTMYFRAHSPGVLDYLEKVLGKPLPRPQYDSAPSADEEGEGLEGGAVLEDLLESAATRQIFKIAPGEKAQYWDECLSGGYICVGWDEVGDLRQYPTKEAFRAAFAEKTEEKDKKGKAEGHISKKANELWTLMELRPGDLVLANRGKSELMGVGEVLAPGYEWREDRSAFKHTVRVRWSSLGAQPRRIPEQPYWAMVTVAPVPRDLLMSLFKDAAPPEPHAHREDAATGGFGELKHHLQARGLSFSDEVISHYLLALQTRRFVILTGISGTGKTQLAIETAEWARSRVRKVEAPAGAVRMQREPYMTDHGRMVLPAELKKQLELGSEAPPAPKRKPFPGQMSLAGPLPGQRDFTDVHDEEGAGDAPPSLTVSFGTQQADIRLWRERERNLFYLPLKSPLLEWFEGTVPPGGVFFLEAVGAEKGPSRQVRFFVPAAAPEPLDTLAVVAVRPDWTDPRGLLGHYNPLTRRYSTSPFLERLLAAAREAERAEQEKRPPRPFFVILDEMNLARVEHYFSDFLSCLESGKPLHLHSESGEGGKGVLASDGAGGLAVPRELRIPENVFFTGTVNVDETTFTFSPKVLDRAFVIEFNHVDLRSYGASGASEGSAPFQLTRFPGYLDPVRKLTSEDWEELGELAGGRLRETLVQLHELLAQELRHFGYRVANEMARFLGLAARQTDGSEAALRSALDLVILSKVLSRLHGTQQELEVCLSRLFAFLIHGQPAKPEGAGASDAWEWRRERLVPARAQPEPLEPALPRSAAKVWRMLRRLRQQGFTSFIE